MRKQKILPFFKSRFFPETFPSTLKIDVEAGKDKKDRAAIGNVVERIASTSCMENVQKEKENAP